MFGARTPLIVIVKNGRWDALGDPTSPRAHYLMRILKDMGGINETVTDGIYNFNVRRRGFKIVATLHPAK